MPRIKLTRSASCDRRRNHLASQRRSGSTNPQRIKLSKFRLGVSQIYRHAPRPLRPPVGRHRDQRNTQKGDILNEVSMGTFLTRLDKTEALRAYAMFDIAVMDHKSKKYAGKGFYLSNGVLKGFEGLVFHTLTADDCGISTMVEGPT